MYALREFNLLCLLSVDSVTPLLRDAQIFGCLYDASAPSMMPRLRVAISLFSNRERDIP